jgi:PKD repeat protein
MKRFLLIAFLIMLLILPVNGLPVVPCSAPTRVDTTPDNACDLVVNMPRYKYGDVITSAHFNYPTFPGVNITGVKWQYYNNAQGNVGLSGCIDVLNTYMTTSYVVEHYPNDSAAVYMGPKPYTGGSCSVAYGNDYAFGSYWYFNLTSGNAYVNANFTGTPREGTGPLQVDFTDTSDNATSWNWTITPGAGWYVEGASMITEDLSVIFTANGNYTISHGVTNGIISDIETKTDYIWIYNSTSMITTPFTAIDLAFGHPITGAAISLEDIQNSSWTNTSATGPDGKWSITTLATHRINGYCTAVGYEDQDALNYDATTIGHYFYMLPIGYTNVTEGNVTVFISVVDYDNHNAAVPYATVTALWNGQTAATTASAAGIARFVLPNSTNATFTGTKSGYLGNTITLNTGAPSGGGAAITGTIYLSHYGVTYSPTGTTIPGGGTPTPITTVLPGCEDPLSAECQASQNNFSMAWLSRNAYFLIQVAFIVTILYMLGWKP